MAVLDEHGLATNIGLAKQTFIKRSEAQPVQTKNVDSTPTANSTNLVTSGGVKTYVDGIVGNIETLLASI